MVVLDPKLDDLLIVRLQENLIAIALLLEVDTVTLVEVTKNLLHLQIEELLELDDMLVAVTKNLTLQMVVPKKHSQKENLTNFINKYSIVNSVDFFYFLDYIYILTYMKFVYFINYVPIYSDSTNKSTQFCGTGSGYLYISITSI